MQPYNWNGLLKVIEIEHIRDGKVIWKSKNIRNLLHRQGEEFLLKSAFSSGVSKPDFYYLGLDGRTNLAVTDTLLQLINEPVNIHAYTRQQISSNGDFQFEISNSHWRAKSPSIIFVATGGSWGPVRNIFLTTVSESVDQNTGYLISSVYLEQDITVAANDAVSLKFGCSLKNV